MFVNWPRGRADGNEPEALEVNARIRIQSIVRSIKQTELHFVRAALAIGVNHHRDRHGRAVGAEVPTSGLVCCGHIRALENGDSSAAADAVDGILFVRVVAAVPAAIVIPRIKIVGVLPDGVEIQEHRLGHRRIVAKTRRCEYAEHFSAQGD